MAGENADTRLGVIMKHSYGIKSADTLWTRLVLDLNRVGKSASRRRTPSPAYAI